MTHYWGPTSTITLDYNWYYPSIAGGAPDGSGFVIYLCQPDYEELLGFPEGSLPGEEIAAKFVLAHEIGHGFHRKNDTALKNFKKNVDLSVSNPLIDRNKGRPESDVFADVLAAYLYSPIMLLNDDMRDWVETDMPGVLK